MLGIPWTKEQGAVYYMNNNTYSKYYVPHKSKTYNLLSMDTMKYKVWRDEKLQQFKQEEETKIKQKADVQFRVHEEAKNMEAKEVALLLAPFHSIEDDVDTAAAQLVVPSPCNIDSFASDSKPSSVSSEEGEDDTATDTHIIVGAGLELKYEGVVPYLVEHQNLPSNMHINGPREELIGAQEPCALRQPRSVENSMAGAIYDVKRKGEITSYYFSQPRPPEHTYVNRYRPWKYASLKACGWGPPLTHASISVSIWSPNIIC
jgi:hypothetical protein